jgi:hypothetical protein
MKIGEEERKELLRYFANASMDLQRDIISKQTEFLRKNKHKENNYLLREDFILEQLLRAIRRVRFLELQALHRKSSLSDEELKEIKSLRIKRLLEKKSRKKEKENTIRKKYFWLIKDLKEQGLSWRKIALYLKKYHKFNVTHGYLQQVFSRISAENSGQN